MTRKTAKEISDQVEVYKRSSATEKKSFFSFSKKISDLKLQHTWAKRNLENTQVMLATLEVESKWFHSDVFISHSDELELKLKRIAFEEIDPDTDSSKILKNFCIILHNKEYNIAIHLVEGKFMPILEIALSIVAGSSSGFHTDVAVFISALSVLSKKL